LSIDEALQVSSQFDAQLIALGKWSLNHRRMLDRWLETISADEKCRMAAQVIASFALDLLKNDLSIGGKIRIKKLQSMASLLEKLVFTTKELEEKFYRDHINHMLKVALLARAIGIKKPFCLNKSQLKKIILASIFHDIAYPLSECSRIFNETLRTLKGCFISAELFTYSLNNNIDVDIKFLSSLLCENEEKIITMLNRMDHGILSSIEFSSFLNDDDKLKYSEVIRAIALHDPKIQTNINVIEDPITGLLILSDELQDWGRPTDQDVDIIPRIEDFILEDGQIKGRFIAKNYKNFSVLKQISSKIENFNRIDIDSDQLKICFKYDVDEFIRIEHKKYERILRLLFNSVPKELMDPSKNIDLSESSFFEKELFGIEITNPIKHNLYKYLCSGQLSDKNDLKNVSIYLNENVFEMLLSKKSFNKIDTIELSNDKDKKISLKIISQNKPVKGIFYGNNDEKTINLSRYMAAEIRYINYMINELGGSKFIPIEGFPKLEGIAKREVVEAASKCIDKNDFIKLYDELKIESITSCLRNRSCFLFI